MSDFAVINSMMPTCINPSRFDRGGGTGVAAPEWKQWATFARTWWIYDASCQCPFKSAKVLVPHLQGKHKPIYHPLSDIGDHVLVINTKHIAMKGDYWRKWRYHHHTGHGGGYTATSAWRLHQLDATKIVYRAVYSHLPGNLLRHTIMRRLHLFEEENVPKELLANVTGQIRQVMPVPKRYDEYTEEERKTFPRLFDWPEDHVVNYGQKKDDLS